MAFWKKKQPKIYPTHMIVGLGNPGGAYKGTRHNVGFEVVELLGKRFGISVSKNKHQALIGEGEIAGKAVVLVKPMTFMNISGRAIKPLAVSYGISPEHILVISDDLDLDVGRVRMKPKGGAGGHNGHKSLIQVLGSDEYPRIKIGIGKGLETKDHVLSRFRPEERVDIESALAKSADGVEHWLLDGVELAMNRTNS